MLSSQSLFRNYTPPFKQHALFTDDVYFKGPHLWLDGGPKTFHIFKPIFHKKNTKSHWSNFTDKRAGIQPKNDDFFFLFFLFFFPKRNPVFTSGNASSCRFSATQDSSFPGKIACHRVHVCYNPIRQSGRIQYTDGRFPIKAAWTGMMMMYYSASHSSFLLSSLPGRWSGAQKNIPYGTNSDFCSFALNYFPPDFCSFFWENVGCHAMIFLGVGSRFIETANSNIWIREFSDMDSCMISNMSIFETVSVKFEFKYFRCELRTELEMNSNDLLRVIKIYNWLWNYRIEHSSEYK